ncbi:MAG: LysM peptidoglycan-binding domain-containing protein [Calditrichaeota bacterium]|nr:MAG: LysM peptidoglycan-binding domain-containing protein [Calditrichota bacterium]
MKNFFRNLFDNWWKFGFGLLLGALVTFIGMRFGDQITQLVSSFYPAQKIEPTIGSIPMKLPMNDRITARIKFFLRPVMKKELLDSYRRSGRYIKMIEAALEEYGLPRELAWLPIQESSYLPYRQSHVGAVGLWQIMPAMASEYGLKRNQWLDERRDPEKSTLAAIEYLRFLYDHFKDWDYALASYNYGYSKVGRAIRREKSKSFWQLRRVPKETYNFVPTFYAICHLLSQPEKYGIQLPQPFVPYETGRMTISGSVSIREIAKRAGMTSRDLKKLNPALTGKMIPTGDFELILPKNDKEAFAKRYKENPPPRIRFSNQFYKVKRGDSLYKIAKKFGTTINKLKADNRLRSTRWINVGTVLKVQTVEIEKPDTTAVDLVDAGVETEDSVPIKLRLTYQAEREGIALDTIARYYSVTSDEMRLWNSWLEAERLSKGDEITILKEEEKVAIYSTKKGDSLWDISKKFGTPVHQLKRWNQLKGSRIYPGAKLLVKIR